MRDIAVQAMRLCRYAGGCKIFWPVGMHLLVVADLLPGELEHHALLHDAAECVVSDVPRPMKTKPQRALEHRVLRRIYQSLGLRLPTPDEEKLIHAADIRAVNAEGPMESGPRGFAETQPGIDWKDVEAQKITARYLAGFNPLECINADGYWVRALERRMRKAITRVHSSATYSKQYTSPA